MLFRKKQPGINVLNVYRKNNYPEYFNIYKIKNPQPETGKNQGQ